MSIVVQNHLVSFTADTRGFVTAKGRMLRNLIVGVHPHTTGFHVACHTDSLVDILSPDSTAEAVFAVISHSHNLVLIVEFDNYGNRPEDFLLRHTHIIGYAGNQSRLHESTLSQLALGKALTAAGNSSALLLSNFNIAQDFLNLGFVDLRTHLRIIIPRQAHLNLIEGFD